MGVFFVLIRIVLCSFSSFAFGKLDPKGGGCRWRVQVASVNILVKILYIHFVPVQGVNPRFVQAYSP